MIYRIYPKIDTTIYEDIKRKDQNVGKDQLLEVGKLYDTDNTSLLGNSRALVEFDLSNISQSVADGTITSPQYRLRLENIESREIQDDYDLFVYPIKEAWSEGLGQEADTPHFEESCTWVNRQTGQTWDVTNSTVGKPTQPDEFTSLQAFYNFAANIGNFELVEKIKGTTGNDPILFVSGGQMQLSSSNYSGGTVNLSASLDSGSIYKLEFDFNRGTLSGVDFEVIDPTETLLNEDIVGYQESLVSTATYKMAFTASNSGNHNIQFTYFDDNGSDGSNGNIDNFYLYTTTLEEVLVFDQFSSNVTTLPSFYILNEGITGTNNKTGSAVVKEAKLFMTASDFGGATLNRAVELQEGIGYTASFDIDRGTFQELNGGGSPLGIEFTVQGPGGRLVDNNDLTGYHRYLTGSTSEEVMFDARETGTFNFRYTFFASASGDFSGSLDNFKIVSADHDRTGSAFNDTKYDAHWKINQGGGTWFTSSFTSGKHYYQSFNKYTKNLDVEVTDYVSEWIDGTRTNNGFIIKKSKSDEESTKKFGLIRFFSSDTHTIYPPVLEARWDDSSFDTGSLEALTGDDIIVYVKNLDTQYKETSKAKIRVFGRERYPTRSFSSNPLKTVKYLPTTSYYSVVDAETEQVLIPFDTSYTKLSCDSSGNYFNFWFNGLQPERFYKFIFRVDQGGNTRYYDDNFYFKVVR